MKPDVLNKNKMYSKIVFFICFFIFILLLTPVTSINSHDPHSSDQSIVNRLTEVKSDLELAESKIPTADYEPEAYPSFQLKTISPSERQINFTTDTHPKLSYNQNFSALIGPYYEVFFDDFDGDNEPDLVIGSGGGLFIWNSTGGLLYLNTSIRPDTLTVGNITGDSTPDLVVCVSEDWFDDIPSRVYFIDGSDWSIIRYFEFPRIYGDIFDYDSGRSIAVADLVDNDSIDDVIVGTNEGDILGINGATGDLFMNITGEEWQNSSYILSVGSIAIANLTGDAVLDFYVSEGSSGGDIYAFDGATKSKLYHKVFTEPPFIYIEELDIIATDTSANNLEFLNKSTGELLYENTDSTGDIKVGELVDLDNDTIPDTIILGTDEGIWWINITTGETIKFTSEYPKITSLDFDHYTPSDNIIDIVAGSSTGIVTLNGENGAKLSYSEVADVLEVLVYYDINNDSFSEVVVITDISYYLGLYLSFSDNIDPVLKSCTLPELALQGHPLEFTITYSEPNLDTIQMGYFSGGVKYYTQPDSLTSSEAIFSLPPLKESSLLFWFWANDTMGNIGTEGNETDYYELILAGDSVYLNSDATDEITDIELADFTQDGILDIVLSSRDEAIYFIDGSNGSTIMTNTDPTWSIYSLCIIDFDNNNIPDIAASSLDAVYFINGSTGQTEYICDTIEGFLGNIDTGDFNGDNIEDIVVTTQDEPDYFNAIYFIDGATGVFMHGVVGFNNPSEVGVADFNTDGIDDVVLTTDDGIVWFFDGSDSLNYKNNTDTEAGFINLYNVQLAIADFTNDSVPDIAASSYTNTGVESYSSVLIIDGSSWSTLYETSHIEFASISNLATGDFNGDNIPDIVASAATGSETGILVLFDGSTGEMLYNLTFQGEITHPDQLELVDFNSDNIPDIVVTTEGPNAVNIVDGRTFKLKYTKDLDSTASGSLKVANFNDNELPEIVLAGSGSDLNLKVIQALGLLDDLRFSLSSPTGISQGESLNIDLNLFNSFNHAVIDASVSVYARRVDTDLFQSYISVPRGDGTYSIEIGTSDLELGKWELFPVINEEPYDEITISDYQDSTNLNYHPYMTVDIVGQVLTTYQMTAKSGTFNPEIYVMQKVTEGDNVTIIISIQDTYYHTLSSDDISVTVFMDNRTYLASSTEKGIFTTTLLTEGLYFGEYNITVFISGNYVQDHQEYLMLDIIPQFPLIDFSPEFLLLLGIISFIVTLLLIIGLKVTHGAFQKSEASVLKSLLIVMILTTIFFAITIAGSIFFFFEVDPMLTFFALLVGFGEIILLFFFWFSRISYQYTRELRVGVKAWIPILILVGVIALMLNAMMLVSTEIEWFEYRMGDNRIDLLVFSIPQLFWDIGIVGFATGFVFVVISSFWETYKNIKELKALNRKIQEDYYPKEPEKFEIELSNITSSSYVSLLTSFIGWYLLIVFAFFTTFQTTPYFPLIVAAGIPLGINVIIFFRTKVIEIIRSVLGS